MINAKNLKSASCAARIRTLIFEGDYRNAAGFAIYEVFGPQRLGKSKRANQCAQLQDNFTIALENVRESLVSKLREVSIYEGDLDNEREVEPIVVYMRCLEALGVDVDREAEHVRQVMRDAIAKSESHLSGTCKSGRCGDCDSDLCFCECHNDLSDNEAVDV